MKATKKFVSHVRWAYVAKLFSASLALPLYIILAKGLGREKFGLFALTLSLLVFVRILSGSGLGPSTGKHISNLKGDDQKLMPQFLAAGFWVQMISAGFFAILVWLFSSKISNVFSNEALAPALKIGAIILVFFAITEFSKAALQGLQRFDVLAAVTGVEFAGKLLFSAGLTLAGYGLIGALDGFALALALTSLVAFFFFVHLGMRLPRLAAGQWRSVMTYSLPLMLTTAGFVIYTELDNIMVGYYAGVGATGLYSAAMNIARAIPLLAVPIGQAAAPTIVKLVQNHEHAADFTDRLLRYVVASFFPIAVGLFVLAPKIMVLIYGREYLAGASALRVMAVFVLSLSTGVVVTPILDYLGKAGVRAMWLTISVSINVILNFILIPRFGGLGAAIATAVTHAPYVLNNVGILATTVGLRKTSVFASLGKVFLASAAAGLAGVFALFWWDSLVVTLVVGFLSYMFLLFVSGILSRGEISELVVKLFVGLKTQTPVEGEEARVKSQA